MLIRRALWTAAIALTSSLFVAQAAADPPAKPVKDARQHVKDAKEKLKDARKESKDAKDDDEKAQAKDDRKEAKKELHEARKKLRETRRERKKELAKAAKDKWGEDLVKKPRVRAELSRHARRVARLNYMEQLAKDNDKTELLDRIQKLREKEDARHQKRMETLKSKGGEE